MKDISFKILSNLVGIIQKYELEILKYSSLKDSPPEFSREYLKIARENDCILRSLVKTEELSKELYNEICRRNYNVI